MNDWFRSWHGAPTDPKWLAVARKAQVAPAFVVAVAWGLMDRASQHADRGSIAGYDADAMGAFLGCEEAQIEAIVQVMRERKIIEGERLCAWEKRQPKREREDDSTSRVREHRMREAAAIAQSAPAKERHVTPRNANEPTETPREDKIRVEDIASSLRSEARPKRERIRTQYPDDFEEFWKQYPTDANMSKAEALAEWRKTSSEDWPAIVRAAPKFAAYARSQKDYRPLHACRFIKYRRFETFGREEPVESAPVAPQRYFVIRGTREWDAWSSATNNNGGRGYPVIQHQGRDGWWFPTRRPNTEGSGLSDTTKASAA